MFLLKAILKLEVQERSPLLKEVLIPNSIPWFCTEPKFCKEEVNHAEVRDIGQKYSYEDFRQEFELGRFVDGVRIPIAELMGCSCDTCPFNVNGKCWNANNSERCPHKPKMEG